MSGQSLGEEWHLLTIFSNGKGQPMAIGWLASWGVAEATKRHRLAQAIEESRAIADLWRATRSCSQWGYQFFFQRKKN